MNPATISKRRPCKVASHLLHLYRHIESECAYRGYPPSNRELVDAGFAKSTSTIRWYFDRMADLGMLEVQPRISRGVHLLPLKGADLSIRKLLKESSHASTI